MKLIISSHSSSFAKDKSDRIVPDKESLLLEEVRKLRNRRRKRIDDKAEEDEGKARQHFFILNFVIHS